jgi:glycerol dehydrogenase
LILVFIDQVYSRFYLMGNLPMQVFCSPLRYVQGISASNQLAQQMDAVGMKPPVLLIASKSARSQAEKAWQESMKQLGWEFSILDFAGECTPKEIDSVVARAKTLGVKSLVGAGGGKVLDTARAAANICNISIALAPSIASTDAPTSALSVVYDEQGKVLEYRIFKRNPDLVLVDISLIAQAPVRFLAAGIGDALSTYFESDACRLSRKPNMRGGLSTQAAFALARFCFDSMFSRRLFFFVKELF